MSTLLWVSVPAGLSTPSTARIRVMVVPRLGDGSLSDLGLQDWPALLANASFELQVKSDDGIHEADRAPVYEPVADSDAWHAFFDGDAGVINQFTQKQQPTPLVRPTYSDARAVVTSYRECTSILTRPASQGEAAVRQRIERFSTPLSPSVQTEEPLPPLPPPIDFHRAVAMLREHPAVLQALGLVFELSAEVDGLDVGTDPRFLRIRGTDLPIDITSPWTKYDLDQDAFWPAPADDSSGIRTGLLDLTGVGLLDWAGTTTPRWALSTLDVDGAVRALRTEARALDGNSERRPALPDLRTGGLMLIRPDRQSDFTARAGIAAGRTGALSNAEFTAEDLVLGYRVDIRIGDDPEWHSLCERRATYTVEGPEDRTITLGDSNRLEEGHVKPYAAVKTPDGRLHADEVVARWDSWSMALPFMNLLGGEAEPEPNPEQAPPYVFRWHFDPPTGRLPRLRFATRYQMRIRIADLTGSGPGLDEAPGSTNATETIFYTRSDPIQPPRLSHDGTFSTGAAIERMVIRSDLDLNAAQFHAANPQYPAVERRTLHPPTVSFALAEQHKKFDPKSPEDSGPQFTERTWKLALRALDAEAAGDPTKALPDPATTGISAHIPAAPGGLSTPLTERTDWEPWPSADPRHVELSEQLAPNPPIRLNWVGDKLDIRLARAEEAVLELSSTIQDDFLDHFSVNSWLNRPVDTPGVPMPVDQWQVTVQNGRHPMLSPVRRIHVVHAVRRPLAEPTWQLRREDVKRSEHDTNAVLRPTFSPTGLNTDSTGRLEISATWREWSNDGDRQQTVGHLYGETLNRGDPPALSIRHEFGDTKHRTVTYTLKAISRFRAYFDATDPDEAFQLSGTQAPVTIPSSARPPDLALLSTTPSFRWQSQATSTRIERSRSSRRLRVELAGPWYETGEGERLAVLVAADSATPAVPVTRLGRDPLFASAPLPPLAAKSWFTGFSEPPSVSPDLGPSVVLVPYTVTREGDRWYADIEITPPQTAPSYAPFVRLALARFQPNSLPGLSLSPIVVTDPVRLLPDRRLVIERNGPDLGVSLLGTGPNPPNRLEAVLEEAHAPPGVVPGAIDLVDLTTPPAADIPAWRPLPSHILTSDQPETPSMLRMPAGTAPLRLRVREVEGLDAPLASASPAELRDRTVFVDAVPLPADWRPS
ncbi:hypothetical protein J7E87_30130 [Streptomyces sp. ISL-1]|uniref:hypothetical protein n=1 Tax=Streptomyces sp. ISL-1 TaxID=2817657 RepID=UPI001BE8E691|nr:hypothetical protein [Streptomyces sp. ISL-1]MBT2393557.1 hypothetical protein [Streptomyces sp. ISL-1]